MQGHTAERTSEEGLGESCWELHLTSLVSLSSPACQVGCAERIAPPRQPQGRQDQLCLSDTHSREEIPWLKGKADNLSQDAVWPAWEQDQQYTGPG